MIRSITKAALLPLALSASAPAWALQILEGTDGQSLVAKISQKEVTRVVVEGNRIKRVTGNPGEFLLEKDEDKGQIYIMGTLARDRFDVEEIGLLMAGHVAAGGKAP